VTIALSSFLEQRIERDGVACKAQAAFACLNADLSFAPHGLELLKEDGEDGEEAEAGEEDDEEILRMKIDHEREATDEEKLRISEWRSAVFLVLHPCLLDIRSFDAPWLGGGTGLEIALDPRCVARVKSKRISVSHEYGAAEEA
jgi:hypothetical protein